MLECGTATFFGGIQFQLHLADIEHLLLQLPAALGDHLEHDVQLFLVTGLGVVEFDQGLAFG